MTKEEEALLQTSTDLINTLGEQNKMLRAKLLQIAEYLLILAVALDKADARQKRDVQSELINLHDSTTEYIN